MWIERGILSEDLAARIHGELPRRTYGVDLD
jgi:predicted urease superfamily metal-dependent hydrolase